MCISNASLDDLPVGSRKWNESRFFGWTRCHLWNNRWDVTFVVGYLFCGLLHNHQVINLFKFILFFSQYQNWIFQNEPRLLHYQNQLSASELHWKHDPWIVAGSNWKPEDVSLSILIVIFISKHDVWGSPSIYTMRIFNGNSINRKQNHLMLVDKKNRDSI